MAASASWSSFSLQVPGKDLLEPVRNVLETLLLFLEVLKTILDTIKTLLLDFGNPVRALVEALIALINTLFESLKRTGIYGWFDAPEPGYDPTFRRFSGGYPGFVSRFKGSLVDTKDPGRPQPIAGATKSGFILLVVDAESIQGLVRLVTLLFRFFGKEFLNPQYGAPANVKVLPLGAKGDPILSIVRVFNEKPKSLVIEWSLPSTVHIGDPGFSDMFTSLSTEFLPPKFLIEKSSKNPNVELDASSLSDASAVGTVTTQITTNFELRGQPGVPIKRKVRLTDEYQDPFVKFEKYIPIDTANNSTTFFLGQLGTFRYIDNDVEIGKTYWYRVRAYSGTLAINGDGSISFQPPETNVIDRVPLVRWPSTDPGDPVVMGRSSVISRQHIFEIPDKFDVLENLKRLFELAFSLNFHVPLSPEAKFNSQGLPATPDTFNSMIGEGSLTNLSGTLITFTAVPILGSAATATSVTGAFSPDPVTGKLPLMPWQTFKVIFNASRLSSIVGGAFLETGNANAFQALMQGALPKGIVPGLPADTTLEKLCFDLTTTSEDSTVMRAVATRYGDNFKDPTLRLNVLQAIEFCKTFTLGGAPPDWIQISLLRDIVPWSGQLLYELLAKIQALLDAYNGVLDEIKAFIDMIERKINTLEQFIEYLLSILDFIESLQVGFFLLNVAEADGGLPDWFQALDNAGGTKPPSGPEGYTAGAAFAYIAADISAFVTAFELIF